MKLHLEADRCTSSFSFEDTGVKGMRWVTSVCCPRAHLPFLTLVHALGADPHGLHQELPLASGLGWVRVMGSTGERSEKGRRNHSLQGVHILIPGPCIHVTLYGKRDFAKVIKLWILRWEDYPGLSW